LNHKYRAKRGRRGKSCFSQVNGSKERALCPSEKRGQNFPGSEKKGKKRTMALLIGQETTGGTCNVRFGGKVETS